MGDLETDYLIAGAGAVGMAFADTLLSETDADMIIVDRHAAPGGHWNDAYPFVRLHQPSAFYGVASTELGSGRVDETGSNKGYFELASGAEVVAYFDRVMRERFLPSGRVRYVPMSDALWDADGVARRQAGFRNLLSGAQKRVSVRKRIVDGTYFRTSVPATHTRKFSVADGVACVTPNELPVQAPAYRRFTVVGGGKTAMDVAVWLLEHGADPDAITWVRPRESWLLNRATTQPSMRFFHETIGGFAAQMEAMAQARSVDDLWDRLEACGGMLRIDRTVRPTMFHFATLAEGEVDLLRRITTVVRGRRVRHIDPDRLQMVHGEDVPAHPDTLYVDCTATATEMEHLKPVFDGPLITLQILRMPLVTFSAALTAHVEAAYDTDEEKNRLCTPIALPDTTTDWLPATIANMTNQYTWSQEAGLREWIVNCRLDGFGATLREANLDDPAQSAVVQRMRENMFPGVMNLQKLIEAG